jgi:hypothetical protein
MVSSWRGLRHFRRTTVIRRSFSKQCIARFDWRTPSLDSVHIWRRATELWDITSIMKSFRLLRVTMTKWKRHLLDTVSIYSNGAVFSLGRTLDSYESPSMSEGNTCWTLFPSGEDSGNYETPWSSGIAFDSCFNRCTTADGKQVSCPSAEESHRLPYYSVISTDNYWAPSFSAVKRETYSTDQQTVQS